MKSLESFRKLNAWVEPQAKSMRHRDAMRLADWLDWLNYRDSEVNNEDWEHIQDRRLMLDFISNAIDDGAGPENKTLGLYLVRAHNLGVSWLYLDWLTGYDDVAGSFGLYEVD